MNRRWLITGGVILAVILLFVVRNQVRVHQRREARAVEALNRQMLAAEARLHTTESARSHEPALGPIDIHLRQALLEALQPVALTNCTLERFGEPHDGGYLMCGNLLGRVQSGYSYGIAGYDKWGCDISTRLGVTVHEYDCFDTRQPACPGGHTTFHAECVGGETRTIDGRLFDTIENQLVRNGDSAQRIVLKIDVEGAEWDSFIRVPDEVLSRIDQLVVEFHRVQEEDDKYLMVVERLKRFFQVAHLHFNNFSCVGDLAPLPAWAYEVLFVNKRIAIVDPSRSAGGVHPLDAPNDASKADCQGTAAKPLTR